MKRTTLLVTVGVSVLALLAIVVGAALANTPSGVKATPVTATQITRATLGKFAAENKGVKVQSERTSADFAIVKVVIEPGGSTGWHHHPGVTLVSVASGTVTEYDKKCEKTVHKAGEGFVESNDAVHVVHNNRNVNAVLYATLIVPTNTTDEGLRIDEPKPSNCNVR